jgi:succinate dehydrogenase / fumarate reductase cytochrome b subunit
MNWLTGTLGSSIGKKLIMALTGLCFIGFLLAHLAGNLTLYAGKDVFHHYAESLQRLGPLLWVFESGLILFAVTHILMGATLFYENFSARPQRYAVNKSGGGRTLGSATMPYTGIFLLIFVIIHLLNFTFVEKSDRPLFQILTETFAKPGYLVFYLTAMAVAAVHVSHGFWSAFQTMGANHPKYMPAIRNAGLVIAVIVGLGFGFLPIYIALL